MPELKTGEQYGTISMLKHGATIGGKATEYNSWSNMKKRCLNPNNRKFKRYGARGIKIDAEWLGENGFVNFLADLGLRPSPRPSLHRIDRDRHYTASNRAWAPSKVQGRNTKRIKLSEEIAEEIRRQDYTIPMTELARFYGVSYSAIQAVLG